MYLSLILDKFVYNILQMNLTLIFIVLSIAIGYMLYDTLKKSRQSLPQENQTVGSRIKTNYASECKILKDLHEEKLNSIRHRSISIHFNQQKRQTLQKLSQKQADSLKNILVCLNKSTKIYVLVNKNASENSLEQQMKKYLAEQQFIPYNSIEGAVAVLRQLNCNLHLESQEKLLKIIKQYIPNIWFAGKDQENLAKYNFNTEFEMINSLEKMIQAYQLREKTQKND